MQRRAVVAAPLCSSTAVRKSSRPAGFAMFAKTVGVGKSLRDLKPFPCHSRKDVYDASPRAARGAAS
jgi:hypothetical protein